MSPLDHTLFSDVADALGLQSPAFVEKDYYAIQLLKQFSEIALSDFNLCFAGGTCLSKAHLPTCRMSEDLDLKFSLHPDHNSLNNSQKKKLRRIFKSTISEIINRTDEFEIIESQSRDEGAYCVFSINYPRTHKHSSLRPELKLEFTEINQHFLKPNLSSIKSLYALATNQESEISAFLCDCVETILIEKFISLLRRTAEFSRGHSKDEDKTLIRHVYDLSLITSYKYNKSYAKKIFSEVVIGDQARFGNRHVEFKLNPHNEFMHGLKLLLDDHKYKHQYVNFLGPLVYHPNPPSWEEGIGSLKDLANSLLQKGVSKMVLSTPFI